MNMKRHLLIMVLLPVLAAAQKVPAPYETGMWPGFRSAAVSFTFDDGCRNQFEKAVPLFNEFGYHLTLYTVTRSAGMGLPDWKKLQEAADAGHEIGAHTLTHTSFAELNDSLQTLELRDCRGDIESNLRGVRCLTMAYPFCVTGNKSLVAQYYLAARICSGSIESRSPRDWTAVSSIICGDLGSVKTAQDFISRYNAAVKQKGWCVFLLHGVDNDGGWSPISSAVLRSTLEYLKEHDAELWTASFSEVVRYIKERDAATLTELETAEGLIRLQLSDGLDDEVFDLPLTLRRPLPEGWGDAAVLQNGSVVPSKLTEVDGVKFLMFDVVPDRGEIVLQCTALSRVIEQTPDGFSLEQNFPNPFNPETVIRFKLAEASEVRLYVNDAAGKRTTTLITDRLPAGSHSVTFSARDLPSGVYFYTLETPQTCLRRKMLLLR